MAQGNPHQPTLAESIETAMRGYHVWQAENPPQWATRGEPIPPAAGTARWRSAEWKKLSYMKLAKYAHNGRGTNWSGHKSNLAMQLVSIDHDTAFEDGAKAALLGSLSGMASVLARGVQRTWQSLTYAQVEERLDAIFMSPVESAMAKQTFRSITQGAIEPISTYISQKQEAYEQAYPVPEGGTYQDPDYLYTEMLPT